MAALLLAREDEGVAPPDFLRRNVLHNLPMLKMRSAYGTQARIWHRATEEGGAALLRLPVAASPFDRETYPEADHVVMLAGAPPPAVLPLLAHVPQEANVVFKIAPEFVPTLRRAFPVRRVGSYVSYTMPVPQPSVPDERVLVADTPGALDPTLRAAMPVTLADAMPHFAAGQARLFQLAVGGEPVAACLSYPNFEHVHEIGVLVTAPAHRGRGYAKALVATAAHDLRARGLTPRYQTAESNAASNAVARAAGLIPFLRVEHWITDRSGAGRPDRAR